MSVNNKISLNIRITLNIKMEGTRHGGVSAWFVKYSSKSQLKKKWSFFSNEEDSSYECKDKFKIFWNIAERVTCQEQ